MNKWEFDKTTGEHQLVVKELDGCYIVMKSAGGDWYCGFQSKDSPCIDNDIEYFDTWQQCRSWCESDLKDRE